jgi:hypothetical protein
MPMDFRMKKLFAPCKTVMWGTASIRAFTTMAFAIVLTSLTLSAKSIGLIGPGQYPVASTNLELRPPVVADMERYMNGQANNGNPIYVASLLVNPATSLSFEIRIPADPDLYGNLSGTTLPVVAVMTYPTTPENTRFPYQIPYPRQIDSTLPLMDLPGDRPIIPDPGSRLPLIIHSHGLVSNPLFDLAESKFLSSHGYAVASVFYGDGRTADERVQHTLRTFLTRAFLDYLLGHPVYGPILDPSAIGTTGIAFGGYNTLAIMGARFKNHPSSVVDARIKAGFSVVPWIAGSQPFGSDYRPLSAITGAYMAVIAARDTSTDRNLITQGLLRTEGPTFVFTLNDEPHALSSEANRMVRALRLLFLDAYVRRSTSAQKVLSVATTVEGSASNTKTLQRNPLP